MTPAGVAVGTAIGIALLMWVVTLIRQDRLYVGYGVIFVFGTVVAIAVLVVPSLLGFMTAVSTALLPAPALSLVALVILVFLMVYVFTQITILSNRVMRLTQELAIRNAQEQDTVEQPVGGRRSSVAVGDPIGRQAAERR
jgi:hypothetical protein